MINLLMDFVYAIMYVVTGPIGSVRLPPEVLQYVTVALDYMAEGAVVLSQFVDMGYLLVLWMIVLEIDLGILTFRALMWVLRKIPLLGMS